MFRQLASSPAVMRNEKNFAWASSSAASGGKPSASRPATRVQVGQDRNIAPRQERKSACAGAQVRGVHAGQVFSVRRHHDDDEARARDQAGGEQAPEPVARRAAPAQPPERNFLSRRAFGPLKSRAGQRQEPDEQQCAAAQERAFGRQRSSAIRTRAIPPPGPTRRCRFRARAGGCRFCGCAAIARQPESSRQRRRAAQQPRGPKDGDRRYEESRDRADHQAERASRAEPGSNLRPRPTTRSAAHG